MPRPAPRSLPARPVRGWAVRLPLAALLAALGAVLPACNRGLINGQDAFRRGDLTGARMIFSAYARGEGAKPRNRVIALLELGAAQHALGEFEASNHSFAQAQAAIDRFDEQPDLSLTTETRALLVNLNELPYRGWDSDRIMAATLRAMNFLCLGDPPSARVSFNRAYRHQQEAVARNAKELENARAAAGRIATERGTGDTLAPENDPRLREQLARRFGDLDKYAVYADYANPFAELLQGLYFLYHGADTGDAERARKSLERAAGMAPGNPHIRDDLRVARQAGSHAPAPPVTHVFFATGTSPYLEAFYLELPLFLVSRQIDYVAANFPALVENHHHTARCQITAAGQPVTTTQPLVSLDAVVGQEFKNRLPALILKSTLSAALKTTAAYAFNRALRSQTQSRAGLGSGDELALLLGRLAAVGYQAATNQADRRIWASLPKKIGYARLPLPASGSLRIQAGNQPAAHITLDPARSHGVWVRSVHPASPLIIQTFPLGPPRPAPARAPTP